MSVYWTYRQIREKLEDNLDLKAEQFVSPNELLGYVNEGIDVVEARIHDLAIDSDYFLTKRSYDLVQGERYIDLPDNIYAHKIKSLIYEVSNLVYKVRRFRGEDVFEEIAEAERYERSSDYYRYILVNDNSDGGVTPRPQIMIVPRARETIQGALTLWYVRDAQRMADDDSVCDIPEFVHYVINYARLMVYYKESHPNIPIAEAKLEESRLLMEQTLAVMVPDKDNRVVPDLSAYEEAN